MLPSIPIVPAPSRTVEGIARVVLVDGAVAWLEPEQTNSCGSCASSAACSAGQQHGDDGIGTIARRIEARRFPLDIGTGPEHLREGDRIVIGVGNRALIKASLLAYALPLLAAFAAAGLAQDAYGSDALTMLAMAGGMAGGMFVARLGARHLARRGDLSPRFLRRAQPGETCGTA